MRILEANGRHLGPGQPCFVIAEAGVNHNGSLELARRLVDAAKAANADAVKFQTFKADRVVTEDAPMAAYQRENTGRTESQFEMLRRLELSERDHRELSAYCQAQGIIFMSTPFDELSADFLAGIGMSLFKVPSGEITNLPYLGHVARFGKPMIVSTGMAWIGEVEAAVRCIESNGAPPLALLHCVSSYPASPTEANLLAMHTMAIAFGVPVGYSDHTLGTEVSLAAVALGACIIEKHLTLDCGLPGPDHRASLEPSEFAELVRCIRLVEAAMGNGRKEPVPSEKNTATVARRSLVAARDILAGCVLAREDIAIKRPGSGLPPAFLAQVVGRRVKVSLAAGKLLTLDLLQ